MPVIVATSRRSSGRHVRWAAEQAAKGTSRGHGTLWHIKRKKVDL